MSSANEASHAVKLEDDCDDDQEVLITKMTSPLLKPKPKPDYRSDSGSEAEEEDDEGGSTDEEEEEEDETEEDQEMGEEEEEEAGSSSESEEEEDWRDVALRMNAKALSAKRSRSDAVSPTRAERSLKEERKIRHTVIRLRTERDDARKLLKKERAEHSATRESMLALTAEVDRLTESVPVPVSRSPGPARGQLELAGV